MSNNRTCKTVGVIREGLAEDDVCARPSRGESGEKCQQWWGRSQNACSPYSQSWDWWEKLLVCRLELGLSCWLGRAIRCFKQKILDKPGGQVEGESVKCML